MHWFGLLAALGAMFAWGFGDFFIQKTTRLIGTTKSLFYIGLGGFLMLSPFVRLHDLSFLASPRALVFLTAAFIAAMFASRFYFRALQTGKISVVEPITGLELPITVCLGVFVWGERLSMLQFACMAAVFVGLVLAVSVRLNVHIHEAYLERGALLAFIGAIGMALGNFFTGTASQTSSPVLTIWFVHGAVAVACAIKLAYQHRFVTVFYDLKHYLPVITAQSVLDTLAWLCFAVATTIIPISVSTTISASYVALAVLLGLILSREKVARHQLAGICVSTVGIIILAALTA